MLEFPRHQDRLFSAYLVQGCRCLTSDFSFSGSSDSRASRVDFSELRVPCARVCRVCAAQAAAELRLYGGSPVGGGHRGALACACTGHAYALH